MSAEAKPFIPETLSSPKQGFVEKLTSQWNQRRLICLDLNPNLSYSYRKIIDKAGNVGAYSLKFSLSMLGLSSNGISVEDIISYCRKTNPRAPIILDANFSDPESAQQNAELAFDKLGVDAATVGPYQGQEALRPFLKNPDKGIVVSLKTMSLGYGEYHHLPVGESQDPLYLTAARRIAAQNEGRCAFWVDATMPRDITDIRTVIGKDTPLIVSPENANGSAVDIIRNILTPSLRDTAKTPNSRYSRPYNTGLMFKSNDINFF